ncbi:MAG: methyltransferase domain-containing protein [Pseudonocardiales bacterium]|nr:methyltransferase domain-containing protein [Pseudonocardiales bacterium]
MGPGVPTEAVEAFMEKVLGDYAGASAFFMAGIGDRLGLFKDLAASGAATSPELAARTGLQERYLREWLAGMAAAGYLSYQPDTGRYALPAEHAPVLAEEAGRFFLGCAFFGYSTNYGQTFHRLLGAFREGGGVPQDLFGEERVESIDRFTAPWFEHLLVPEWLPAMPDVLAKLQAGATVADIGCGRGRAVIKLARAFPACSIVGYDLYQPAVVAARSRAAAAGLCDRVRFEVRDVVQGLPQRYDVVTTFDVVHDSADPRGLLRAIHDGLAPDGRYLCVDITCSERPEDNVGPLSAVRYGLSLAYCMTVSLAEGGAGLGTLGLPEAKLTELASETGFSQVRRVPIEDPFNTLYVLTP